MGYKVRLGEYVETVDGVNMHMAEVYADTADDIPAPSKIPQAAVGSNCIVMDTKDVLYLNTERAWV